MNHREVALLGKVTAGVTHELKNVLAIIKECGGLSQDIIDAGRESEPGLRAKLCHALATIDSQMTRAEEITARMNRFAHTMDDAQGTIDLADLTDIATFLARRGARSRNVSLVVAGESAPRVRVGPKPTRLILLLCALVEFCVERTAAGCSLVFEPALAGRRASVRISRREGTGQSPALGPLSPVPADLADLLRELDCELSESGGPDADSLHVLFSESV